MSYLGCIYGTQGTASPGEPSWGREAETAPTTVQYLQRSTPTVKVTQFLKINLDTPLQDFYSEIQLKAL